MAKLNMAKLDSLKEVSSRIKWKSVLAVLIVLIIVILAFRSLPTGYSVKDDIGVNAYAEPDAISLDGKTTLQIEVKNVGQEKEVETVVSAKAYNDNVVFINTSGTSVELSIKIGPQEMRKLSFEVTLAPGALEGTYRIDVAAKPESKIEGAKKSVYITARKQA